MTVVCDTGLEADALSTACFVLGVEKGSELLKKYNADGLFVDEDHHVYLTDGMKERFSFFRIPTAWRISHNKSDSKACSNS